MIDYKYDVFICFKHSTEDGRTTLGLEDFITKEQIAMLLWREADDKAIGTPRSGRHEPSG